MLNYYKETLCYQLLLIGFMLAAPQAYAGAPEAGDTYMGGSKVEYPDRGVSFILPAGATGFASKTNPDHEMLVSIEPYTQYSTLYIQVGQSKFETIAAEMGRKVKFNGNELMPTGKATVKKGGVTYNDFKIKYEDDLRAFILALVAKNGTTLMLTAIASAKAMPTYKKAMSDITKTVSMAVGSGGSTQAKDSRQTKRPGGAKKHPVGNLAHAVIGAWMRHTNYASGGLYMESSSKWVFSGDGTVAYGSGAVIAGGTDGVSLRGGGDNPPDYGRWNTKGNKLYLHWNDGTEGVRTFTVFDYFDTQGLALTLQNGHVYHYLKID